MLQAGNLIDLDKADRDRFDNLEIGSDTSFFDLPEDARHEALRIYLDFDNRNVVTRELDRSKAFRGAFHEILKHKGIDVYDTEFYLQAVDTCNRYFDFIESDVAE